MSNDLELSDLELEKRREEIKSLKTERRIKIWSVVYPIIIALCLLPFTIPKGIKELRDVCLDNIRYAEAAKNSGRLSGAEVWNPLISVFDSCSILFPGGDLIRPEDIRTATIDKRGGTPPSVEPGAEPSPAAVAAATGWVAVGFLPNDLSFTLPDNRKLADLAKGDKLTAKGPVNLRKAAADWTAPLAVVGKGQSVVVIATKGLSAGSLTQVWAEVKVEK